MQANLVQRGNSVDYTPGSAVSAGDVIVQNSLVGVASKSIAASALGALDVVGVFDVVKATGQINAGAAVYWDADGDPNGGTAGTGAATTTSSGNSFMGYAALAAGSSDATVRVRLFGVSNATTIQNPLTVAITDPGNAGAIPVTNSGYVPIVTAGAETRTLAAPNHAGEMISIAMKTDGGDCVITCATGINQAANTTITLNDAGDSILLVAIYVGSNLRWRVVVNDGCTLG